MVFPVYVFTVNRYKITATPASSKYASIFIVIELVGDVTIYGPVAA